jgi:carboxyl-terminal processing protease
VNSPVDFRREINPDKFPVTDQLLDAFKEFVAKEPAYNLSGEQLEANRDFISRQLRYEIATAAYGLITAERVLTLDDPQVLKAIEVLPKAAALAGAPRNR